MMVDMYMMGLLGERTAGGVPPAGKRKKIPGPRLRKKRALRRARARMARRRRRRNRRNG